MPKISHEEMQHNIGEWAAERNRQARGNNWKIVQVASGKFQVADKYTGEVIFVGTEAECNETFAMS